MDKLEPITGMKPGTVFRHDTAWYIRLELPPELAPPNTLAGKIGPEDPGHDSPRLLQEGEGEVSSLFEWLKMLTGLTSTQMWAWLNRWQLFDQRQEEDRPTDVLGPDERKEDE